MLFLFVGLFLSAQTEFVVHNTSELMKVLKEQHQYTFSFPEEIAKKEGQSLVFADRDSRENISKAFANLGCEVFFLTEKHILLRPALKKEEPSLSTITIKDSKNGEAISWAALIKKEKNEIFFSDLDGEVKLNSNGEELEISMLGYKSQTVKTGPKQELVVLLEPDPVALRQVEKQGSAIALVTGDGNSIVNYTNPYALMTRGLGGIDVFSAVQSLPGVDAAAESGGKISIRGSNADETLLVLDGLPIFNNAHYFDIFGTINPYFIQGFELYKNAYPTQYSGRTGGMLSLTSKDQKQEKLNGVADLNFLSASGAVFLPISKSFSVSAAVRNSFREISNNNFYSLNPFTISNFVQNGNTSLSENTIRSSPSFSFGDFNLKLNYEDTKTRFQFSINQIRDNFQNTVRFEVEEPGRILEKVLVRHELQNDRFWKSNTTGFNFSRVLATGVQWHVLAYRAYFKDDYRLKVDLRIDRPGGARGGNSNAFISQVKKYGLTSYLLLDVREKTKVKAGYDLEAIDNRNALINPKGISSAFNSGAIIHNLFGEIDFANSNGWKFNAGTRITMDNFGNVYPSMQSGVYKEISPGLQWRALAGYNYQLHRRIDIRDIFDQSLSIWSVSNKTIPALSALSVSTGLRYKSGAFLLDVEPYFKKLAGVGEFANPQPGVRLEEEETRNLTLYNGDGKSYGMDLLSRYDGERYSTQLSYSWSKLIYQIPGVLRGQEYFAPSDRRHQLKSYHAYKMGDFLANVSWIYATGQPYLIGNRINSGDNLGSLDKNAVLDRLPNYSRIDAGISYNFKLGRTDHTVALQLYNLTNRQNVKMVHYLSQIKGPKSTSDQAIVTGTVTNMLNRTINLGWTLRF